jgi:hypothetical protein
MKTVFSSIVFDQKHHTYTLDGKRLASVTGLVSKLKNPFDSAYWAQRKADERGVAVQVILDEWDAKGKASIERGHKVHEYIAKVLLGQDQADPFLALNGKLPEMQAFDGLWKQIGGLTRPVEVEWVVGDGELGVAGTVDTLFYSDMTGQHHVWDWKTGDKFKANNPFQRLLPPFDDLDECEVNTYSVQTSLYRLIVERNLGLAVGESYIVHLAGNGEYHLHKALDLRERVEKWLRTRNN